MKYLRLLSLFSVCIILIAACVPVTEEKVAITVARPTTTPPAAPSPTRPSSPTPPVQTVPDTTTPLQNTPHSIPVPTVATPPSPPSSIVVPPTSLTYVSQCEVWTRETDGTLIPISDTGGQVSGFARVPRSTALAYLTEGDTVDAPQAVYLKRSAEQTAELIFDPSAIEWSRTDGYPLLVRDIAFSADGRLLALTTLTGVWLFNTQTSQLHHIFERAEEPADVMAYLTPIFSPDNRWLLVTVQQSESRREMVLDLESGESFALSGSQGYTETVVTLGWVNKEHIARYHYFYDGNQHVEYKVTTYTLPDYQEGQTYQLGRKDFFDDSQIEDFVVTRAEKEKNLLTSHWHHEVTAVVDAGHIYFLLTSQDERQTPYTTLLHWQLSTQTWDLLYKNRMIIQGELLLRSQADGARVVYVRTADGQVFHLNLTTQAPELVTEEAGFHSGSRFPSREGCTSSTTGHASPTSTPAATAVSTKPEPTSLSPLLKGLRYQVGNEIWQADGSGQPQLLGAAPQPPVRIGTTVDTPIWVERIVDGDEEDWEKQTVTLVLHNTLTQEDVTLVEGVLSADLKHYQILPPDWIVLGVTPTREDVSAWYHDRMAVIRTDGTDYFELECEYCYYTHNSILTDTIAYNDDGEPKLYHVEQGYLPFDPAEWGIEGEGE